MFQDERVSTIKLADRAYSSTLLSCAPLFFSQVWQYQHRNYSKIGILASTISYVFTKLISNKKEVF